MAGAYPKNGPGKANWEFTRLETYGNQTSRKTPRQQWQEDVMEDLTGRRQQRKEELGETWLRR